MKVIDDHALLKDAPEPVILFHAESLQLLYANSKACHLLEYSGEGWAQVEEEGWGQMALEQHICPRALEKHVAQALQGANPVYATTLKTYQGKSVPVEVRLVRFPPFERPLVRMTLIAMPHQAPNGKHPNGEEIPDIGASMDMLDQLAEAVIATDHRLRIRFWNQAAEEMYGWKAHEVLGKPMEEMVPVDYLHRSREAVLAEFFQNGRWTGEVLQYRKNGEAFEVFASVAALKDVEGNQIGAVAINRDMARQRRMRARLARKEAYYQAIAQHFPNGIIALYDHELRFRVVHGEGLTPTGWRPEDMEGKALEEGFPSDWYQQHKEDFLAALAGEKIESVVSWGTEYFKVILLPVKDESGNIINGMMMSQNITPLKQTEFTHKETLEQLELAIKTAKLGIWRIDRQHGDTLSWNDELLNIYGISRQSFEQDPFGWERQLPPEDLEKVELLCRSISQGGNMYEVDIRVVRPGGEVRYVRASGAPVFDEAGNITELIGINIDITRIKENEAALKEREAFFRGIFENSLNGILVADDAGNYLMANQAVASMLGYPIDQLTGMNVADLNILSGSSAPVQYQKFVTTGQQIGEITLMRPDGEKRILQFHAVRAKEDFNISLLIDITPKKEVENALLQSEERFRLAFDQQFQFMLLLSPEGRIVEVNNLFLEVFHLSRQACLGQYLWEVPCGKAFSEWSDIVKAQFYQVLHSDQPLFTEDRFPVHGGAFRITQSAYTCIRDEQRSVKFILIQANDITEEKKAKEKLKRAQKKLTQMTNRLRISTQAAKVGIWEWQPQHDHLIWNEIMLELYGITRQEFSGNCKAWIDRLHPADLHRCKRDILLALRGKKDLETEFRIRRKDGSIRMIKAIATIQDEEGAPIRMLGTHWDITKEKEAEKQRIRSRELEIKNKELEQFAFIASHDLMEPLRTVSGFANQLKKEYNGQIKGKSETYLNYISQSASRMTNMVKALLDYSRIGANKELVEVDCNRLVKSILQDLTAQIEDTQGRITASPLPRLMGYQMELRVLFQNLISNAIKFRKPQVPPQVHISAVFMDDHWRFSVQDNGIGIAPPYRDRIFVLFQRLHARNKYEGTGIGLAHCQKIVDLHGGKIWVESTSGNGSTFYFTIPQ